jgi:uracil phosphoribosyltransferase|nr:hypothetical protein [Neorhizobium tomejilense]
MTSASSNYDILFQCFVSGQMSDAQLQQHMREDQIFKAWVDRKLRERIWTR